MSDDAAIKALTAKVSEMAECLAAFRGEYIEGRRAAKEIARSNAAFQDATNSQLSRLDLRTQKHSQQLEVLDEKADRTNGRVTALERKDIARDAVADVRRWRFPAFIAVVASVTSSLTVAGVIALLTLR